ncbi:hypothetical protein K3495_g7187 [Podosphaera aphanis]|nr:hypothetical protein K3495_g7187 [Podosphaera aphanis]
MSKQKQKQSYENGDTVDSSVQATHYPAIHQINKNTQSAPSPASNTNPTSTHQSTGQSASLARIPGVLQMLGSAKKPLSMTPHGRAARRELEIRKFGATPSRDRRKSGKQQQKETPRDDLRTLSRLLATKTQPTIPTPEARAPARMLSVEEDNESDEVILRPRLSLAIEEDDEDDSLLLPPHSAGLEDDNFTVKSIEIARRAFNDHDTRRSSRGSFGSTRMSDAFADLSKMGLRYDGDESSYLVGFTANDNSIVDNDDNLPIEDTKTSRILETEGWFSPIGRESGIRPQRIVAEDTDTFILTVPQREETLHTLQSDSASENEAQQEDHIVDLEQDLDSVVYDTSLQDVTSQVNTYRVRRKKVRVSRYGIQYSPLPVGFVKKLATNFARSAGDSKANISKDTLDAVMQATDWFFEQVSDDLKAYAKHAGRKTIDESDVLTLMARQRQIDSTTTPFSLARRYLPQELLQEIRMVLR